MSEKDVKKNDNKAAFVAIAAAFAVSIFLVSLGYIAFVNSGVDDEFANENTTPDQELTNTKNDQLPALDEPVTSEEIQNKIDNLSKDFSEESTEADSKKLDKSSLSEERLGL